MPGLPTVTPYVPKVPPIELPPEVPWPPKIEWPPLPGPWVPSPSPWSLPGLDLLPPCWPEFATRFMALTYRIMRFRLSLGLPTPWPPFDLRMWATATPDMVNLAALYVVELMWNSMKVPGGSTIVVKTTAEDRDCTAVQGAPGMFDYTSSDVRLNQGYGIGASFTQPIPSAASVTTATLTLTHSAMSIGTGTLIYRIRAAKGPRSLTSHSAYASARSAAAAVSYQQYGGPVGAGETWVLDVTSLVKACAGASGITFCVDDWDDESAPSVTRSYTIHAYHSWPAPDGMEPTLTIVRSGFSVTPLSWSRLTRLECTQLMAWLAYAEGVVGRHA